jgi:hypothetical protein
VGRDLLEAVLNMWVVEGISMCMVVVVVEEEVEVAVMVWVGLRRSRVVGCMVGGIGWVGQ